LPIVALIVIYRNLSLVDGTRAMTIRYRAEDSTDHTEPVDREAAGYAFGSIRPTGYWLDYGVWRMDHAI